MLRQLHQVTAVFLASGLATAIILWQLPARTGQQLSMVLLATILLVLQPLWRKANQPRTAIRHAAALFLSVALVDVLILSTGGLESPFLLLAHLSILALSLLYGGLVAISFLATFLGLYAIQFFTQADMRAIFLDDPATYLLYGLSLLIIAPLSLILANRYNLKDQLAKAFARQAKTAATIIDSIEQMVLVTDKEFNILSANAAVDRYLNQPSDMSLGKSIWAVFFIKDPAGNLLNANHLASSKPVELTNLTLITKNSVNPVPVSLSISPIMDMNGTVEQFGIVIDDAHSGTATNPLQAFLSAKQSAVLENLRQKLVSQQLPSLAAHVDVARKIERDRNVLKKINQEVLVNPTRIDIARLLQHLLAQESTYAAAFGAQIALEIPLFSQADVNQRIAGELQIAPDSMSGAYFTVQADQELLSVLLSAALDVSLLAAVASGQRTARVILERSTDEKIIVTLRTVTPSVSQADLTQIFLPNFGEFPLKAKMQVGSAMEGFIVATLGNALSLPVQALMDQQTGEMVLSLTLKPAV